MKQATRSGLTPLYRLHMHNKHVPIVRKGVLSDSVAVAVVRLNTGRLGPTTAHRPRHAVAANRPGRPGVERRGLSGKRRWLEEGGHRAKEWKRPSGRRPNRKPGTAHRGTKMQNANKATTELHVCT